MMGDKGYWFCPNCRCEIMDESVTYQENHELCGSPVTWIEPTEEIEMEIERADRNAITNSVETGSKLVERLDGVKRRLDAGDLDEWSIKGLSDIVGEIIEGLKEK